MAGLRYLLHNPTAVGYLSSGSSASHYSYVEASCEPLVEDRHMNKKRYLARDKLIMALVRLFRGVSTWWP